MPTRWSFRLASLAIALLAVGACSKKKSDAADREAPAKTGAAVVAVTMDGAAIAKLTVSETKPVALHTLLPKGAPGPDRWMSVHAQTSKGNDLFVKAPGAKPGRHLALWKGDSGAVLGMRVVAGGAGPAALGGIDQTVTAPLDGVATIDILTRRQRPKASGAPLPLTINGEARTLTVAALQKLEGVAPPDSPEGRKGWRLRDVVGLLAKLDDVDKIEVVGRKNNTEISGKQLRSSDEVAHLKLNRRGAYRFKQWTTKGGKTELSAQLRGVKSINVTLKKGAKPLP